MAFTHEAYLHPICLLHRMTCSQQVMVLLIVKIPMSRRRKQPARVLAMIPAATMTTNHYFRVLARMRHQKKRQCRKHVGQASRAQRVLALQIASTGH
jgi:hypothetical protein